jgi:hypothetical protein
VGTTTYTTTIYTWTPNIYYFTLTGLRKNTQYEVSLQAVCSGSTSAYSNTLVFRTSAAREISNNPIIKDEQLATVFPNPVTNTLYLKNIPEDVSYFRVIDISGHEQLSGILTDPRIDVSLLQQGNFILQLQHKNEWLIFRFIKK